MPVAALWRYLHPDASVIAGAEWQAIARSPLGDAIRSKLEGSPVEVYLDGAESILVSSPGHPAGVAGALPPFVAAIRGPLSHATLRQEALYSQAGGGAELLILPRWIVALVDPETVLVGDLESVKAVLDQRPAAPPPISERAARIAPHCDAWLLTVSAPSWFFHAGQPWSEALIGVERVEMAAALRGGLVFELHLFLPDAQAAASLAATLAGIASLARLNSEDDPARMRLLERLEVYATGEKLRIEMELTGEQMPLLATLFDRAPATGLVLSGAHVVPCRRLVDDMAAALAVP